MKKVVRITESDLHNIVKESVNRIVSEISASLADKAAGSALAKGREGFGKYPKNELPKGSYHHKKFMQGQDFLKYRNDKLHGYAKDKLGQDAEDEIGLYYPDGKDKLALKNYSKDKLITKPYDSIGDMERDIS